MKVGRYLLVVFAIICLACFPAFPNAQVQSEHHTSSATFHSKMTPILQHPDLNGVLTAISIRHAETGELLYTHQGHVKLRPASNLKLLTAAVALEVLGPEYQFPTEILTDGHIKNGIVHGHLYIKGKGDPTLMPQDLHTLASFLKSKGIQHIQGDIIGDDHWYDHVRYSQDLIWSDQSYHYGGAISALTISPNHEYDAGSVIVKASPGEKAGDSAKLSIEPETEYVTLDNQVKTTEKQQVDELTFKREFGSNRIMIQGELPVTAQEVKMKAAVWEPTKYGLDLWKRALQENGISWGGKVKTGITPEKATILTERNSMPLKELLIPFMKLSNNIHAEVLIKEIGKVIKDEGSWESGLEVMEETLNELGLDTKQIQLRDGSGISDKNLIPANELSRLLFNVQQKDWYPIFEQALPVAGATEKMIGGTLRNRLTETRWKGKVHAKTGTLTGVSTLSGYIKTEHGERLVFSIMMNNYIDGSMSDIQDEICKILMET